MTVPARAIAVATAICLTGCGPAEKAEAPAAAPVPELASATAAPPPQSGAPFEWPASLRVVGDGYPTTGAVCRRIGESAATVDLLDDSADLIGCPAGETAAIAALGGRSVGIVDGVALVSAPRRAAAVSPAQDARVADTRFNAIGSIRCQGPGLPAEGSCRAGVVRRADRSADVTVLLDGREGRTLSFDPQGRVVGYDTHSEIAGEDTVVVTVARERYEFPTALLWGG